jgi:hypothetical protein
MILGLLLGVLAWTYAADESTAAPQREYLADILSERTVYTVQDWGELGINAAVKPPNRPPEKLRIGEKTYDRGLGHHANGEIVVELSREYNTFEAEIGIQWQGGANVGSVVFQAFVDGKKCFDSGVVRENDPPRKVSVPLNGAEELRLVVTDAGDGITCDCANWADASLIRDPRAPQRQPEPPVNIASFGRIVAWETERMEGTRAGRTEEFPGEDVFLAKEVQPGPDGTYPVPLSPDGAGNIGLQWDELRYPRELTVEFSASASTPSSEEIQAECWVGESRWQGAWKPLTGTLQNDSGRWTWVIGYQEIPRGTEKVRWVFRNVKAPIGVKSFTVLSRSAWRTLSLRAELEHPLPGRCGRVAIYNGSILSSTQEGSAFECPWDLARELKLKVRYSSPKPHKGDRTVLRFELPDTAFGVGIEDLLVNDCVYVSHAGLFVVRDPSPVTLSEHRKRIAKQKTVLSRVREMPDQTFEQAIAAVHNPVQDMGPMMLSLACDNRKFVVHREGTIVFELYEKPDEEPEPIPQRHRLVPRFGEGGNVQMRRRLDGGWLPIPVSTMSENAMVYRQRTFVAPVGKEPPSGAPDWLREKALCVAEFTVENTGERSARALLTLTLLEGNQPAAWQRVKEGLIVTAGKRLVAFLDAGEVKSLTVLPESGSVVVAGVLPAHAIERISVYLPAWSAGAQDYTILKTGEGWAERVEAYWNGLLAGAMQVELPDRLLSDVIRASQVHCMLAARNEDHGARVSPWISSDRYGPLESESNSIIRGMDFMGHEDFARRSLEFFIKRYNRAGFLTTGYTLAGTGEHLWTLAEHVERAQDVSWFTRIAPEAIRLCRWIVSQRAKTKRLNASGERVPEYGLMPPGVTADWNRYAYRFFNDAQYCAGLQKAASLLAAIDDKAAQPLLVEAENYREDILGAYRWTQARSPVVKLQDGTFVPASPAMLYCFGNVEEFIPGEDGNRSWAYSVELGSHHLVANQILDAGSDDATWMTEYLEDFQFLRSGMGDYPEQKNRGDFFNLGGFAKLQPYYARIAEVYALRDDVKPFVRSYFNAIPSLLSLETLSFWEHFHNQGGWNKTHETGWFLCQSRIMLVDERGEELWLAPFVPAHWLKHGMKIVVKNAPTRFGEVGYTITSSADGGIIEAMIQPPTRSAPERIIIRLRHPDGKRVRDVTINGVSHEDFDSEKECVRLKPTSEPIIVRAHY